MEISPLMLIGFLLAAYSIVANDVIQTLGTFLSSNQNRPWWIIWIFASVILIAVILFGWITSGTGDVSYGRLEKYPYPEPSWGFLVAPIALVIITRLGFPVSTTFLILTVFAPGNLGAMLTKSLIGYGIAIISAFIITYLLTRALEQRFYATRDQKPLVGWVIFQWCSTAFLWSQWLIQDLANIFVYLPRELPLSYLIASLIVMVGLHAYIFYQRGGKIQKVVLQKTNTTDIRVASMIDIMFALILLIFKEYSNMPMSTTWVFLGLLAGREIAVSLLFKHQSTAAAGKKVGLDIAKAAVGLTVSIIIALLLSPKN